MRKPSVGDRQLLSKTEQVEVLVAALEPLVELGRGLLAGLEREALVEPPPGKALHPAAILLMNNTRTNIERAELALKEVRDAR